MIFRIIKELISLAQANIAHQFLFLIAHFTRCFCMYQNYFLPYARSSWGPVWRNPSLLTIIIIHRVLKPFHVNGDAVYKHPCPLYDAMGKFASLAVHNKRRGCILVTEMELLMLQLIVNLHLIFVLLGYLNECECVMLIGFMLSLGCALWILTWSVSVNCYA